MKNALVVLLCTSAWASGASILLSNLNQTDNRFSSLGNPSYRLATDFLTSTTPTLVTGVTLRLANNDLITHHVRVEIFGNDSADQPGLPVGEFASRITVPQTGSPPDQSQDFTLLNAGISLDAQTKYWLVVTMLEPRVGGDTVSWNYTTSQALDAGSEFQTVPSTKTRFSADDGATYGEASKGNQVFALQGRPVDVPEPSPGLLVAGALLLSVLLRTRHNLTANAVPRFGLTLGLKLREPISEAGPIPALASRLDS